MADDMAWRRASAAELGRGIGTGEIDPVTLAEAFLSAIEAHPMASRIYARTTPARARAEAEAARQRALSGTRLGPLDGVPLSWKDLFDTAGVATESGSRLLAGRVPEVDCEVLRRATAAGTVCLGKTHLSELAFSGLGVNPMTATSPNRHDPERAPGGSSSGAAASVSFDLAPAGIGSDTGGSVRVPAAWHDLVGLKTTAGVLPNTGVVPLCETLDTVGPLCRTIEDAALLFAILAEREPAEIEGLEPPSLSLLVPEGVLLDGVAPEIMTAFEGVLDLLGRAGCPVTRMAVPALDETLTHPAYGAARVGWESWNRWGPEIEANPGVMFAQIEARFRLGQTVEEAAFRAALDGFAGFSRQVQGAIAETGLIALPTVPSIPPLAADLLDDEDGYVRENLMTLRNTKVANWLGLSAITVPTGTPWAGFMLVAAPHGEERLLRAGRLVERLLAA